ncbi:MAG: hypothetical protein II748_01625 [Clostridia bacterium]|nr:hypothetical protein [Clostridia bacterium]
MKRKTTVVKMLAAALAAVMTAGVIFTSCGKKKIDIDISKVDTSDRDEKGYSKNMHDALLQKYGEPKADIYAEGQGILGWWDNWERLYSGNAKEMQNMNADGSQMAAGCDEGRGFYARETARKSAEATVAMLHNAGLKAGAWIEGQGDSVFYIMAMHQNEDGTFKRKDGVSEMTGFAWSWGLSNPKAKKESNYICWAGVHSFVNNEEWAYPYVISEYPDFPMPTYPDGTPATGYLEGGDPANAHLSKIYDACAAKNINGETIRWPELSLIGGTKNCTLELTDRNGTVHNVDYCAFGKDSSAPFWHDYNKYIIDYYISIGTDFFWVDNWNGWDNINNDPLLKAFGDWSEYKFREYLKENTDIKVNDIDNFSISQYLKNKAKEWDPNCDPSDIGSAIWNSAKWTEDPIWMAYLAFKAKENRKYNSEIYELTKQAGEKYNGDRDSVSAQGNDFPYMTFAAFDCDKIDIVNTEYGVTYSAATAFNTTSYLPNAYSGHCFSLISNTARSHNAVIWYYAGEYPYTDNSGKVNGYEALSHNCIINSNNSGTVGSLKAINNTIGTLKEYLSDRRQYAEIGVMYSPDSETSELAPGGFSVSPQNTHDISYMGWCHAFDELNIPYKSIQFQRIDEQIDDCSVIILPNVLAIDQKTIDDVFMPWLKKGGTLVITGDQAGKMDCMENNYAMHKNPILAKFAQKYKDSKKYNVIYFEKDPCLEYFLNTKKYGITYLAQSFLTDFEDMMNEWYEKGYLEKIFEIDMPAEASIGTTLNYSQAAKRFFVDIVNMQYDFKTDVLDPMPETVTVKVRIPSNYWGYEDLKVSVFNDDTGEIRQLEKGVDYTIDETYMTIKVSNIAFYATVMIEAV